MYSFSIRSNTESVVSIKKLGSEDADQMIHLTATTGAMNLEQYFESVEHSARMVSTLVSDSFDGMSIEDLFGQRERSEMHKRLLAGDPEAEVIFLKENRKVSRVFIERLLMGFYGTDKLLEFSEKQIRILLLMLQSEEMNEMAVCYFTELLERYEKKSE